MQNRVRVDVGASRIIQASDIILVLRIELWFYPANKDI